MKKDEIITLIPARKNSKGIKNKNIIKVNGKHLVQYTLDAVKNSKLSMKYCFTMTDDKRVKNICKKYGANTDYERPKNLSNDKTLFSENLMHFYKWTKYKSINFKYIIILQPTSPMRTAKDLNSFLNLLEKKMPESLISISKSLENPQESIFLRNKKINFYLKNSIMKNRQDYPYDSYFINGAIYAVSKRNLEKNIFINFQKTSYFEMDKVNSFDLNDYDDLKILKKLIKR